MSLIRRAKRRDETEPDIVKGLRQCGHQVLRQDFPDLLLRHRSCGHLFLLEVEGITKYRKRKEKQLQFLKEWGVPIVKNLEGAMASIAHQCVIAKAPRPNTSATCT